MKTLFTSFLMLFFCLSLSAQETSKKNQYAYYVSNVSSEEPLQKLADQINASGKIADCKYRFKAGKNSGELVFTFEEKPVKGEHDKTNELPNIKEIIINSGLRYEGFTVHTINP